MQSVSEIIDEVISRVSELYGAPKLSDWENRAAKFSNQRTVVCYILHKYLRLTYREIGDLIGKSPKVPAHYCDKAKGWLMSDSNSEGKAIIRIIEEEISGKELVIAEKKRAELKEAMYNRIVNKPVVYELLARNRSWTFNSRQYRDDAYDYCKCRGLNVMKSATGRADKFYDNKSLPQIYEDISKTAI